jgi:hypothetical protein
VGGHTATATAAAHTTTAAAHTTTAAATATTVMTLRVSAARQDER